MSTIEERKASQKARIEAAAKKLEEEKARLAKIEQRQKALESRKTKKREDRMKVLIGSMVLDEIKAQGETYAKDVMRRLDVFLKRDAERALFNLPPMAAKQDAARIAKTTA